MKDTVNYKEFLEDYGAMPFQVDGEMAGKLCRDLVEGYEKGSKGKYGVDEGSLLLNGKKYKGFNIYPYHKSSTSVTEDKRNQKVSTTSIQGRELTDVRYSADTFHTILHEVEKLTGLSVVKIDILRQSKTGKEGKKKAIFLITLIR